MDESGDWTLLARSSPRPSAEGSGRVVQECPYSHRSPETEFTVHCLQTSKNNDALVYIFLQNQKQLYCIRGFFPDNKHTQRFMTILVMNIEVKMKCCGKLKRLFIVIGKSLAGLVKEKLLIVSYSR